VSALGRDRVVADIVHEVLDMHVYYMPTYTTFLYY